jgi:hypothetical protein
MFLDLFLMSAFINVSAAYALKKVLNNIFCSINETPPMNKGEHNGLNIVFAELLLIFQLGRHVLVGVAGPAFVVRYRIRVVNIKFLLISVGHSHSRQIETFHILWSLVPPPSQFLRASIKRVLEGFKFMGLVLHGLSTIFLVLYKLLLEELLFIAFSAIVLSLVNFF